MQMIGDSPRSTCFFVGVIIILWKCKKQPTIALFMTRQSICLLVIVPSSLA